MRRLVSVPCYVAQCGIGRNRRKHGTFELASGSGLFWPGLAKLCTVDDFVPCAGWR